MPLLTTCWYLSGVTSSWEGVNMVTGRVKKKETVTKRYGDRDTERHNHRERN